MLVYQRVAGSFKFSTLLWSHWRKQRTVELRKHTQKYNIPQLNKLILIVDGGCECIFAFQILQTFKMSVLVLDSYTVSTHGLEWCLQWFKEQTSPFMAWTQDTMPMLPNNSLNQN